MIYEVYTEYWFYLPILSETPRKTLVVQYWPKELMNRSADLYMYMEVMILGIAHVAVYFVRGRLVSNEHNWVKNLKIQKLDLYKLNPNMKAAWPLHTSNDHYASCACVV